MICRSLTSPGSRLPKISHCSSASLYVDRNHRRHGLGRHIIQLAADYGLKHDLSLLWLTVNRHNQTAIDFYLGNGFVNTEALVQDIGGGFVMDDFKMVKQLTD
jgi:diamine N-acetyltransferase